ncbi:MAG: BTAD domain-containing putative transcriptional regulator [Ilumatobacteraceae bacterium]
MSGSTKGSSSVRLLGPVDASRDGATIGLGGPSARMVFVQLALVRGRVVANDQLMESLWGEWAPSSAESALRVHLSTARAGARALGLTLDRRQGGYVLDGDLDEFDVDVLDGLEATCLRGRAGDHLDEIERALALWRGPSLVDLRRLALGERIGAGFDRRRAALEERHLEALIDLGRAAEAVDVLEAQVADDPLNEHSCALLAKALYCVGQQTKALRVIERTRRSLADELGLDLHEQLRHVEFQILSQELQVPPSVAPVFGLPSELAALAQDRFFGRHTIIDQVSSMLDDAVERRRSRVVRITGESGSGKSRLIAELARRRAADGWRCLYGWCEERLSPPLMPLMTAVQPLATPGDRPETGDAGSGSGFDVAADGDARRFSEHDRDRQMRLLDWMRRRLSDEAGQRPLVVFVDDVQWADDLTLTFLRRLARTPMPLPLVVIAGDRTADRGALASGDIAEFALRSYTDDEIVEIAEAHGLPPAWVLAVESVTAGLPLLVHDAVDRGPVELATGELAARSGQMLLAERWRALDDRGRLDLQYAAIIGTHFELDHLLAVLGRDTLEVLGTLDFAYRQDVVQFDASTVGRYSFTHSIMRAGILDSLTPPQRQWMHRHVIDALGPSLDALSAWDHAEGARSALPAAELAAIGARAAEHLYDQLSFTDCLVVVDRLLAMLGDGLTALAPALRARLRLIEGVARATQGEMASARLALSAAIDAAEDGAAPEIATRAHRALRSLGYRFTEDREGLERLRKMIDQLPSDADDVRFGALHQLADDSVLAGHYEDAEMAFERLEVLARSTADVRHHALLCGVLHLHAHCLGDSPRRLAVAERMRQISAGPHTDFLDSRRSRIELMEALHRGDAANATVHANRLVSASIRVGEPRGQWLGMAALTCEPLLADRLDDAAAAATAAFERGNQLGVTGVFTAYQSQLFAINWLRGDLEPFVDSLGKIAGPDAGLVWRSAHALALASIDQQSAAVSVLSGLGAAITAEGEHWLGQLGVAFAVEAAWLAGDPTIAASAGAALDRHRDDHLLLGSGALDYGPVARYRALAAALAGETSVAIASLELIAGDPRSGVIWQRRARDDLRRLRGPAATK